MTVKNETIFKFDSLSNAQSFADRCTKIHLVVLGDDDMYWVVTLAHASRLHRQIQRSGRLTHPSTIRATERLAAKARPPVSAQ